MQLKLMAVVALLVVTPIAPPAHASTETEVAGGWQATPSLVPTGGDIATCEVTYLAVATVVGAFNGVWHEEAMETTCDQSKMPHSLPYRTTGSGTFTGSFFGDHSTGSFTWTGTWTGDAISGQAIGVFEIVASDGDASWGCSSGRLTFTGYVNVAVSFGGYNGTWVHGC